MNRLILIGNGGHSKVIQDIVYSSGSLGLYAILDDNIEETYEEKGVIYSNLNYIDRINVQDYYFCIAIGDNQLRKNIYDKLTIPIERYAILVHPTTVISESAKIGYGTVIMPNAIVNAASVVGNHSIINTGAIVEHDNNLGDFVHISPNATLSGSVTVGVGTHLGSASTVIPGTKVGEWSKVGAGAVVVKNVKSNTTVVGVPAKYK